ncbi:hypothetical protein [Clostridium sp.]|uniref:hypothetical protein n=1 Tax=Clostridium sp. TaxID=1506 RepID=UPI003EEDCE69
MNYNYNEFIEISEPYEVGSPFYGLKPPDTVVGITNSYPIYLKLQEDNLCCRSELSNSW